MIIKADNQFFQTVKTNHNFSHTFADVFGIIKDSRICKITLFTGEFPVLPMNTLLIPTLPPTLLRMKESGRDRKCSGCCEAFRENKRPLLPKHFLCLCCTYGSLKEGCFWNICYRLLQEGKELNTAGLPPRTLSR